MADAPKIRYVCPVCQTGFTEDDLEEGRALRRAGEVYCPEHFLQAFPWECVNHPGTTGTGICTNCGRVVCDDCTIDIAHHRICAACKQH